MSRDDKEWNEKAEDGTRKNRERREGEKEEIVNLTTARVYMCKSLSLYLSPPLAIQDGFCVCGVVATRSLDRKFFSPHPPSSATERERTEKEE